MPCSETIMELCLPISRSIGRSQTEPAMGELLHLLRALWLAKKKKKKDKPKVLFLHLASFPPSLSGHLFSP